MEYFNKGNQNCRSDTIHQMNILKVKLSFKSIIDSVSSASRLERDVTAAGILTKKKDRVKLGTSDKLKISKVAGEGSNDKFTFLVQWKSSQRLSNGIQLTHDD